MGTSFAWQPLQGGVCTPFRLVSYLRHIMPILGLDCFVADRLDGRPVVFYQAVFRRSHRPRIQQALEPALQDHRAAYRRHYGGKGAPCLRVDVEPRFLQSADSAAVPARYTSQADATAMPVINTFIQF